MALRKVVKEIKQKEAKQKKETYSAGKRNELTSSFNSEQREVLTKYGDFSNAIADRLRDYFVLSDASAYGGGVRTRGGPIPDKNWTGKLETEDCKTIDLELVQSYSQPGVRLTCAQAQIRYDPEIDKKDVDIVRKALTDSGLEKQI